MMCFLCTDPLQLPLQVHPARGRERKLVLVFIVILLAGVNPTYSLPLGRVGVGLLA